MQRMRCYLLDRGHIRAVELVTAASDEAAIMEARALFEQHKDKFTGFEIWDRGRFVYQYPARQPTHSPPPLSPTP